MSRREEILDTIAQLTRELNTLPRLEPLVDTPPSDDKPRPWRSELAEDIYVIADLYVFQPKEIIDAVPLSNPMKTCGACKAPLGKSHPCVIRADSNEGLHAVLATCSRCGSTTCISTVSDRYGSRVEQRARERLAGVAPAAS